MVQKRLSIVIPCRDLNDPKLKVLLSSIQAQDFHKEELEILTITEGTSESAKGLGIRKAKGEVIAIFASDNVLVNSTTLSTGYHLSMSGTACYPIHYSPKGLDPLGRYFALIGGNDPLAYYMGKNDRLRLDQSERHIHDQATFGDNGFFVLRSEIAKTDLDNYYHIDNAMEIGRKPFGFPDEIVHNTGGNIIQFFQKRYKYGVQHAFNKNRRWKLVDFSKPKDMWRFIWFLVATMSIIIPLMLSIRGWLKIQDKAWFLHPVICLLTVFTYILVLVSIVHRRIIPSSSARLVERIA